MRVTVVCYGALRDHLPEGSDGRRAEIDVPSGTTVADLPEAMGAPRRLLAVALIDGEPARLTDVVPDGSEITLMPPFSGGS